MAANDNVVLAGLSSTLALRDVPYALRVRTNAPEPDRARRIEQQQASRPKPRPKSCARRTANAPRA